MGSLLLLGSGEFTAAMEPVDRQLLADTGARRVAIVPTAAGRELDWQKWITGGVAHFERLGASPIGVPVATREEATDPSNTRLIETADWIYFSGGDPDYLHRTIDGTPLWEAILARLAAGAILAGSSAGAVILGSHLLENPQAVFFANEPTISWRPAFGLVQYVVLPHYDWALLERPHVIDAVLAGLPPDGGRRILGIDEDTALLVEDGRGTVMGRGTVHVTRGDQPAIRHRARSEVRL